MEGTSATCAVRLAGGLMLGLEHALAHAHLTPLDADLIMASTSLRFVGVVLSLLIIMLVRAHHAPLLGGYKPLPTHHRVALRTLRT